jgi:hypothetical protein
MYVLWVWRILYPTGKPCGKIDGVFDCKKNHPVSPGVLEFTDESLP